MRALPGTGDLQCGRHRQLQAGAKKGPCVLAPVLLIEIHRQQMTSVVLQQGVEAKRVFAGQMAVDRFIRYGQQLPVAAIAAGHTWLLADPRLPFIRAGRRIARSPAGPALPAQGVDVVTTAEQTPEQGHLLLR